MFSLISKAINPSSSIHAFEPIKRVYLKLKENVELNNYSIKTYQIALSDVSGEKKIFDNLETHEYTVSLDRNRFDNSSSTEISINRVTMHDFIENNDISSIDLIKIDVEYHEYEVLLGMKDYLKLYNPTIIFECVEADLGKKIQFLLDDCNYIYFNIDEEKGAILVDEISKSFGFNYLVCTKEKAKEIGLL